MGMTSATLSEARANFPKLVKRAMDGETIVIILGRNRTPVAKLEPVQAKAKKRLGALETPGFVLSPGFFEPLDEDELAEWRVGGVMNHFEGGRILPEASARAGNRWTA